MNNIDRVEENNIVNEVQDSFLQYSMSVIVARALPDLRDGLKPVHRRILYSMFESGYTPDKNHKKSARIVGDVMGKYHPHGDSSIYEAMVRMAQDFSYRYMLIDGHGNFGNIEGYGAAAMRYTESRLSKISLELLRDIKKETVTFVKNFDESEEEPEILPSRFPNILVNGTMGIAVGMATNIPPHNLGEVIDGCVAFIDNPEIDTLGLMEYIKGPDFPTGGIILGNSGIKTAYETGRGSITIRSNAVIEEKAGKTVIVISEVPYGVNTHDLRDKVAGLVHNKVIEDIVDYHTDLKNGLTITITLKKGANAQIVLNNLYKYTELQTSYGIIFLMLDNRVPRTLGLKDIITKYIDYQKEIIIKRTRYDLNKAEQRVHVLQGLRIALNNIEEVIKTIKSSKSDVEAKEKMAQRFELTEIQSEAILEMKFRRLTGLEKEKIEEELKDLIEKVAFYTELLGSNEKIMSTIREELLEIREKYSDKRRTVIDTTNIEYLEDESLISEENIIVTLTNNGYIKRINCDVYKSQNRGGVGVKGITTNEEDYVEKIISMTTHEYLLIFTNKGKVYRIKGYEVPNYGRQAKGLPIVNLLPFEKDEQVKDIIKLSKEKDEAFIVFCTQNGLIKKTSLSEFDSIRKNGKKAITLKEDDSLVAVRKSLGNKEIMIAASNGQIVKFLEEELRDLGRSASGVKGINLKSGEKVVGMEIVEAEKKILVITENGYGKQSNTEEYRQTHRGSRGVKGLNVTEKNGKLISFKMVEPKEDLIISTNTGMIIRIPVEMVSSTSRVTQGVRLINLKENQKVATITVVDSEEDVSRETCD